MKILCLFLVVMLQLTASLRVLDQPPHNQPHRDEQDVEAVNETLHHQHHRQLRMSDPNYAYRLGMLGAACRVANFLGKQSNLKLLINIVFYKC
jgi:hypothetical protein